MITYRRLERVLTYVLILLIANALHNFAGAINHISGSFLSKEIEMFQGPNFPSNIGFLAITLPAIAVTIYLLRKLRSYHKLPPWQNPENRPLPPKPKPRRKPPQPAKLQVSTWAQKPFNTREITWMIPFFLFGGIYALSNIETAGHPGQPDSLIFQNLVIGSLMLAMIPSCLCWPCSAAAPTNCSCSSNYSNPCPTWTRNTTRNPPGTPARNKTAPPFQVKIKNLKPAAQIYNLKTKEHPLLSSQRETRLPQHSPTTRSKNI